eukprot:1836409-Rhodomonas_salina.3
MMVEVHPLTQSSCWDEPRAPTASLRLRVGVTISFNLQLKLCRGFKEDELGVEAVEVGGTLEV